MTISNKEQRKHSEIETTRHEDNPTSPTLVTQPSLHIPSHTPLLSTPSHMTPTLSILIIPYSTDIR